jgi:hypothetical protein
MINVKKYFDNGFYFGNVEEFIDDMADFNKKCEFITSLPLTDEYYWSCHYLAATPGETSEPLMPSLIPLNEVANRQKIIEENNLNYISRSRTIVQHQDIGKILKYFLDKSTSYIESIYGSKYTSYYHGIQCYTKGDKLDPHTDNHNVADCAMVIYFSPDKWNNNGGILKLTELGNECLPRSSFFSLLDLTKHRIRHEVTTVTRNFKRYSYLLFAKKITKLDKT